MATDYDAPRRGREDEEAEHLEEVKAATATRSAQQPNVDEDETVAAESFELPGADLFHEELVVEVQPQRADEFVCSSCFLVHHWAALADRRQCCAWTAPEPPTGRVSCRGAAVAE